MAAGFSRRFGRADKRTAQLADGDTLLKRTLKQVITAFDGPTGETQLVVVIRPEDRPEALGIPESCTIVRAPNAAQGLGASIADAVGTIQQDPKLNHIVSLALMLGDMPAVRANTLMELLTFGAADAIVRPRYRDKPGHPVLFGRTFWSDLQSIDGPEGARSVISAHKSALRLIDVDDAGVIWDIDTPQQLEQAAALATVS